MGEWRHQLRSVTAMAKFLPGLGIAVGSFAVILQFALTINERMALGDSLTGALFFYFSFFTILTNIAAVLVYAAYLFPGRLTFFTNPVVRGAIGVAIIMVGLVYVTVLAALWSPQGLYKLCDMLLHYIAPVVYAAWWLTAGRKGVLKFSDTSKMLIYPILYLAYVMLRGQLTGLYPYPFLNANTLGLGAALMNAALIAALFLGFALGVVAIDRSIKTRF